MPASTSTSSSSVPGCPASAPPAGSPSCAPTARSPSSRHGRPVGGTWDLFRYPGVRSDSDVVTFTYPFRPWTEPRRARLGCAHPRLHPRHRPRVRGRRTASTTGSRSSRRPSRATPARWTVTAETVDGPGRAHGARSSTSAPATSPTRPGTSSTSPGGRTSTGRSSTRSTGPRRSTPAGKRIVVIGSGATAVTLVPALVDRGAAHVTMLQRSPGYVLPRSGTDRVGDARCVRVLPAGAAHRVIRAKNLVTNVAPLRGQPALPGRGPHGASPGSTPASSGRGGRARALHAGLRTRGTSACASCRTATSSPRSARGRVGGHRHRGPVHPARDPAGRRTASSRPTRSSPRPGCGSRWPAACALSVDGADVRAARALPLQGRDVRRGAQPRGLPRLHQQLVDAARRPHVAVRVRGARADGGGGGGDGHAAPGRRPRGGRAAVRAVARATSSARATCCPSRARGKPWTVRQNYFHDLRLMSTRRVDDGTLEFAPLPVPGPPVARRG